MKSLVWPIRCIWKHHDLIPLKLRLVPLRFIAAGCSQTLNHHPENMFYQVQEIKELWHFRTSEFQKSFQHITRFIQRFMQIFICIDELSSQGKNPKFPTLFILPQAKGWRSWEGVSRSRTPSPSRSSSVSLSHTLFTRQPRVSGIHSTPTTDSELWFKLSL